LDELPEFKRSALEVLRQPIEDGNVTISRSAAKVTLPCRFMLVASMNPCPCGFLGDPRNSCRCSIPQIQKYRSKISGPLLDRIDLHIEAPAIDLSELPAVTTVDSSVDVRARVECCRATQHDRFNNTSITSNAFMRKTEIEKFCKLSNEDSVLLIDAMKRLNLSARAYDRILKVSRTIADLGFSNSIKKEHVLEAIQYRNLDRTNY
ncbi:MAG: ATP-binding protein, partial [Opitutales bacterium]|nr:ATP-binding protein [Opitutales bacterium]